MQSTQVLTEDLSVLGGTATTHERRTSAPQGESRSDGATSGVLAAPQLHVLPWTAAVALAGLPVVTDRSRAYEIAKRLVDVSFCIVALPALLLMMVAVAIAVRIDSPGPILFRQVRVGRGGRTFRMYKFRSLRADYEERVSVGYMQAFVRGEIGGDQLPLSAEVNKPLRDADMTRLGRALRQTSLDEIPQIWNVLKGEMSLVGPRPNVEWEVAAYAGWHRERLDAVPGITGLAQIRGRSWVSFDRIALADIEYVRRQSLLLDLHIIWMTLRLVFQRNGAG
jgi:lipopolysaccharide/colanic/teichoic acid biosynthesis glycosyltransferase